MSDDPNLNLLDFPLPAAAFRKARKATLADVNNLSAAVNGGPDYVNKRLLTDKRYRQHVVDLYLEKAQERLGDLILAQLTKI